VKQHLADRKDNAKKVDPAVDVPAKKKELNEAEAKFKADLKTELDKQVKLVNDAIAELRALNAAKHADVSDEAMTKYAALADAIKDHLDTVCKAATKKVEDGMAPLTTKVDAAKKIGDLKAIKGDFALPDLTLDVSKGLKGLKIGGKDDVKQAEVKK